MEGDILAFVVCRVKSFQAWQSKLEGNNKVLTSNNELKTTKQSSANYIKIFLENSLIICQRENTCFLFPHSTFCSQVPMAS